jgi:hypothetical protein
MYAPVLQEGYISMRAHAHCGALFLFKMAVLFDLQAREGPWPVSCFRVILIRI